MKQVLCQVVSQAPVTPGVSLAWFESPEIAQSAKPGQFVMVKCGEETFLRRPFSIYETDSNKDKFAILYARVGKGTTWLSEQKADSTVDILGPLGNGFSIYPASHNVLLVAGGNGIAPLRFLADKAVAQGKKVTLLMGASSAIHLLPEPIDSTNRGLLTDGVLPWGITIHKITDDGSEGYKGLVTHLLVEQHLIGWADQIFACGPMPMYKTMARMPELKNKPVQVSLEVRMGCGRGLCYGCTLKTRSGRKKVCADGPVFDLDDIAWDELSFL